ANCGALMSIMKNGAKACLCYRNTWFFGENRKTSLQDLATLAGDQTFISIALILDDWKKSAAW
ncbi:hypothetical protein SSX86_030601, partial [Deinandra increscens subsp. villosa]